MAKITGSHLFVRSLKLEGIKKVFTIVGDTILPLVDAAADEGIEFIDTRHEGAAMHMADGYSRPVTPQLRCSQEGPDSLMLYLDCQLYTHLKAQ